MKLNKFDVVTETWEEVAYPFPHTLAKALCPGVEFAIVHADADTEPEALAGGLPQGWHLDYAAGAKKKGDFVMSTSSVASLSWPKILIRSKPVTHDG